MRSLICLLGLAIAAPVLAHQPIMDMAPRWNGGYGVQTRLEYNDSETTNWLEGVYTFKPAVRMTLKLPFVDGELGDAVFAVPLKRYRNEGAATSNWSITPAVRAPTGGGSSWDAGLGLSFSSESRGYYELYDLYRLGDTTGLDINVGLVFPNGRGASWFTLWDITATDSPDGQRVLSGPVLVYFKRNVIFRAEYKLELLDNDSAKNGNFMSVGVGVVY